jgi:hypothetical protein
MCSASVASSEKKENKRKTLKLTNFLSHFRIKRISLEEVAHELNRILRAFTDLLGGSA